MLCVSSDKDLWYAVRCVLNIKRRPELCIVTDGLDQLDDDQHVFVKGIGDLLEKVREQAESTKIKILLTWGTQDQRSIKALMEHIPWVVWIGYDVERNGMNLLGYDAVMLDR